MEHVVYCNKVHCLHNKNNQCVSKEIRYVNRLCMTYERELTEDEVRTMMQHCKATNCHKKHGKYTVDHVYVFK